MKRLIWTFLAGALMLGACTPAAAPTPTALLPTIEPGLTSVPATTIPPTLVPAALSGPQAGTTMAWSDGSLLVYVPAGDFIMGMGAGNVPQKTVSLNGYWIYKTDVTNKMYGQCVATGNCAAPAQEIGTPVYTNPVYGDYPCLLYTSPSPRDCS